MASLDIDLTLVPDGGAAIEAFGVESFDLILMDAQMPRMDGLEATAEIRRIEQAEGRRRTPVIALTANVMEHQTKAYRAVGMDGFVAKPIELSALVGAIQSVLSEPRASAGGGAASLARAPSA